MSYQEKRILTNMVVCVAILVAYSLYTVNAYRNGLFAPDDLQFTAKSMLLFIGAGVVLMIVTQIAFHILVAIGVAITRENCDEKAIEKEIITTTVEDEMDKLIELKALKLGYLLIGVGMALALGMLAFGLPGTLSLNALFLTMGFSTLAEGAASLYYYRRGVDHA